jgi:hypothetical protein
MALPSLKATTALQGLCQMKNFNKINNLNVRWQGAGRQNPPKWQENPAKDSAQTARSKLSLTIATYLRSEGTPGRVPRLSYCFPLSVGPHANGAGHGESSQTNETRR